MYETDYETEHADHISMMVDGLLDTLNGSEGYISGLTYAQQYLSGVLFANDYIGSAVHGTESVIGSIKSGIKKVIEAIKNAFKAIWEFFTGKTIEKQTKENTALAEETKRKAFELIKKRRTTDDAMKEYGDSEVKDFVAVLHAQVEKLEKNVDSMADKAIEHYNAIPMDHFETNKLTVKIKECAEEIRDTYDLDNAVLSIRSLDDIPNGISKIQACGKKMEDAAERVYQIKTQVSATIDFIERELDKGNSNEKELNVSLSVCKTCANVAESFTKAAQRKTNAITFLLHSIERFLGKNKD